MESGHLPGRVVWVSLDAYDNDPGRFRSQVLDALRATGVVRSDNPLAEVLPLERPSDAFYLRLVDGLFQLRKPVVLVLDALHEVIDVSVWQGLAMLLRNPAPMLRLVSGGPITRTG